jgi:hypothetical protein
MGIAIPEDRTTEQPARGYCLNMACAEDGRRFEFEAENDHFACPKCGADSGPTVGLLVLTHLLIADPRGPLLGQGGRFRLACAANRAYLATITNLEAATGEPTIANCPGCLAEAKRLGVTRAQGQVT